MCDFIKVRQGLSVSLLVELVQHIPDNGILSDRIGVIALARLPVSIQISGNASGSEKLENVALSAAQERNAVLEES